MQETNGELKSIIFDIDGVLVDVSESYRKAIQQTVATYTGTEPTPEKIQSFKERGGLNNDWDLSEALILDAGKKVSKQAIIDTFQEHYLGKNWAGFIANEKLLLPKKTIVRLAKKYPLGILTGRPRAEAEFILTHFGIRPYFLVLVAMEDTGTKPKPDPLGLQMNLAVLPAPSMYLGDSVDDMKAAVRANIAPIGVIPPTVKNDTLKEKLLAHGAQSILDSITEIETILPSRNSTEEQSIEQRVRDMVLAIKNKGDTAVLAYNTQFDKNENSIFQLSKEQIEIMVSQVDTKTLRALQLAAENIKAFAQEQMKRVTGFAVQKDFGTLEQRIIPLTRVGCYVPGGRYPLPSTALMTVIPAKVAGVTEVIVCSPNITPVVVAAATIAGADTIFNIGGVQAIGAMAYGTTQVPRVDKIVGPGNAYVAEAKRQVYGVVGIDFIAGPSEVLIIADETAHPVSIAADLLAQAEHDPDARANLITTSQKIKSAVEEELQKQLRTLSTKPIAEQSLKKSTLRVVSTLEEAVRLSNELAPEHLELQLRDASKIIPLLTRYGSLFVGQLSAEALGDYCLGPSHTLPTNGAARYTGGLSVRDFVKVVTVQTVTTPTKDIITTATTLATIEGLSAHAKAAELRSPRDPSEPSKK